MKNCYGLFIGGRGSISLGRLAFWLTFSLAVYFWLERGPQDFPPSLENTLAFVLAYNFGGKAIRKLPDKQHGENANEK